jgi:flavorubredoxin
MNTTLREGIEWVGIVDWEIRDFHGYETFRGSSYNSYLVRDDKTALIDSVKGQYAGRLLAQAAARVDPARVDYVVCNHAEPDHSGALPAVMGAFRNAELVCDARCRDALGRHYDTGGWRFRVVADGDSLPLGRRTLRFIETPMVHWPESMFTHVPEEKLLFSMDAFGQHYASAHRFDDEEPADVVMAEAKTYYANIVMPYGKPVAKVLDRAATLAVETIAPSHGVVWRRGAAGIITAYRRWSVQEPAPKVLVVYDTMWGSTREMARAIQEGAAEEDVDARLCDARRESHTTLATETLDAAGLACGSPTLNGTLMPQMAAALTYLKGLRPLGKTGFAFGSYGWSKGGAAAVEQYLKDMNVQLLREPLQAQYAPGPAVLDECRRAGRLLAQAALAKAGRGWTAGNAAG